MAWVCEEHNAVSEKLGKPRVPCDEGALLVTWRTGHPACVRD
jgi:hypothetical protein